MKLTKDELLKIISESTWKDDPYRDKSALYDKYYPLLKAQLLYCPSDRDFSTLSSLDMMQARNVDRKKVKANFEDHIRTTDFSQINKEFATILKEIETDADRAILETKASELCVKGLRNRQKRRHALSAIFIGAIIILSLVVFALALLECLGKLDESDRFSALAGVLDLGVGVIFFLYELWEDKKQKEICKDAEEVTPNISISYTRNVSKICVCGPGNNVGNFGDTQLTLEQMQEKIDKLKKAVSDKHDR